MNYLRCLLATVLNIDVYSVVCFMQFTESVTIALVLVLAGI